MFQGMRYVYEVYKEMSFSQAAKKLYISQPSLSAAVKKEESKIGFPIFDRSSNPIRLTEIGREYIRSAELILGVENGFRNYVDDLNEMRNGSIAIGGTMLFTSYVLPPLLSRFTELFPMIRIDIAESSTAELTEKLFSGALDLLMDYDGADPAIYEKRFYCKEHLLLAVPKKLEINNAIGNYALTADDIKSDAHLSSRIPPAPLELLKNEQFLLLKEGNDTRTRAEKLCRDSRFVPNIKLELEQQATAYNLSRYGMGIAFVGDALVKLMHEKSDMLFYKLDERDAARDINIYYRRSRYMTKAVGEFLKLLA